MNSYILPCLDGKTILSADDREHDLRLVFTDGTELVVTYPSACCCYKDSGELVLREHVPSAPAPEPPKPTPVRFWRPGTYSVTMRRLDEFEPRTIFTLDDASELIHYWAPISVGDFADVTFPCPATLTVKECSTFDKLAQINAGLEPASQTYTFTAKG